MIIAIGADHGGFKLKEKIKKYLVKRGYTVRDYGTCSEESCDYPEIGYRVAEAVIKRKAAKGILICKTGIGQAIVANKVLGIRAAVCHNLTAARYSREHNDVNVLVLAGLFVDEDTAKKITALWLKTRFQGGRHRRRVEQIKKIEKSLRQTADNDSQRKTAI